MARIRDSLSAFLLGEVSPSVLGRSDLDQYKQMCSEVTNMIIMPQGGAKRRPGTQYLSNNSTFKYSTSAKLVPFVISKTESYVLVFTNDILLTGHPVLSDGDDAGITIYSVTDGTIQYPQIQHAVEDVASYYNKFRGYTTPTQLEELQYAQYGNTMFFAQKDQIPFAIQKLAGGNFYIFPFWGYSQLGIGGVLVYPTNAQIALSFPYGTRNLDTASTITPSATTGSITLTAAADIFNVNQIGSTIRIVSAAGTKTGVATISAFTDTKHVTAQVLVTLGSTTATANWALSQWGKGLGWPRSVAFFQNRIVYGGSNFMPNAVWGSRTGNVSDLRQEYYVDESLPVINSDPFTFSIAATELDQIQWLSAGKTLAIGTLGREYVAFGPDASQSMGPLNVNFDAETAYGSKAVQPIRRDNLLVFVQRSGRKAREFVFNFQEDSYKAEDLMIYAGHMTKRTEQLLDDYHTLTGEIVEIVHQEADDQITWFRDSNRGLFAVTRNRDLQITGFHYHKIAGDQFGGPFAQVLSICSCPSVDGTHDDLYMMVRREINVETVTYLERIGREFEIDQLYNDSTDITKKPIYSDSCKRHVTGDGLPALTHSGYTHLIGQTVAVVGDGIYRGTFVVDNSGVITLTAACVEVLAGLPYRSLIKPSSLNIGSVIGSSQGAVRTIDQITFRFVRTIGAKFGLSVDDMYDINFRDPNAPQNDPIKLFTGDKELAPPQGWDTQMSPVLVQDLPFPMQVISMITRGVVND